MNIAKIIKDYVAVICAGISCILVVIALFQTKKQIKLSNKQSLFDRRLKSYLFFATLYKSYSESKNLLKDTDDDFLLVDDASISLTNNTYLEEIQCIIENTKNNDIKKKFLYKISELNELATENELIFEKDCKNEIKQFITDFSNLFLEIYKYQILFDDVKDWQKKYLKKTSKELKEQFKELNHRKRLIFSFKQIEKSYKEIENKKIIEKMKKQIEL